MQPIDWLKRRVKITCNVTFTRSTPVTELGYKPHLVVAGDTEYKGITFLNPLVIGENVAVRFEPLYSNVDYTPLLRHGVKFELKEGSHTVGTGVVTFVRDKYCSQ